MCAHSTVRIIKIHPITRLFNIYAINTHNVIAFEKSVVKFVIEGIFKKVVKV